MLLLVLILVLIAFGLLLIALYTGSVLWAWVSVAVSIAAGAVLLVDELQRRAAIRAGAQAAYEPARQPAPRASEVDGEPARSQQSATRAGDFDPITEVLSVVPPAAGSGDSTRTDAEPVSQDAGEDRFARPVEGDRTAAMPVTRPSGSVEQPSGASSRTTPSGGSASPSVVGLGVESADSGRSLFDDGAAPRTASGGSDARPSEGRESVFAVPPAGPAEPGRPNAVDVPTVHVQPEKARAGSDAAEPDRSGPAAPARGSSSGDAESTVVVPARPAASVHPAEAEVDPPVAGPTGSGRPDIEHAQPADTSASVGRFDAAPAEPGSTGVGRGTGADSTDTTASGVAPTNIGSAPSRGPAGAGSSRGDAAGSDSSRAEPAGRDGSNPVPDSDPDDTGAGSAGSPPQLGSTAAGSTAAGSTAAGSTAAGSTAAGSTAAGSTAADVDRPGVEPTSAGPTGSGVPGTAAGAFSAAAATTGAGAPASTDPTSSDPSRSGSGHVDPDAADSTRSGAAPADSSGPDTSGRESSGRESSGAADAGSWRGAGTAGAAADPPVEDAPADAAEPADALDEPPEEPLDLKAATLVAGLEDEVVVIDEQPRYHVAECRFLVDKPLIPLPAREAVELGFTPCGWCTPDRTLADRHRAASR